MVDNQLIGTVRRTRESGRVALCGYFLSGYRTPEMFYDAVRIAEQLDVIEFGIPSNNPHLDGQTIERAHHVVVHDRGVHTETSLALIGGLKNLVQPRFVMTYAKEGRAMKGFFRLCVEHHIHGVLAPDISLEEERDVATYAKSLNLAYVSLLDTSMSMDEIKERSVHSDMVYLKVSKGRTGSCAEMSDECAEVKELVGMLRKAYPDLIIAAGIGIQHPDHVAKCASIGVDMVVVGTVLMETMNRSFAEMAECIASFRHATRLGAMVNKQRNFSNFDK